MCKKCKNKKKKGFKIVKRAKLGLGLFSGVLAGLLVAPKKGAELRGYFKSAEFKYRLKKAKERVALAKGSMKEKFEGLTKIFRKRFGR